MNAVSRHRRVPPFASSRRPLTHALAHLQWQWQEPPRFIDASATSLPSIKEPSPSRGPTTRPLRASPRHPWLSLRRRRMSSCGVETHLLFITGHSAIDASDTSARRAPGAWMIKRPAQGRIGTPQTRKMLAPVGCRAGVRPHRHARRPPSTF